MYIIIYFLGDEKDAKGGGWGERPDPMLFFINILGDKTVCRGTEISGPMFYYVLWLLLLSRGGLSGSKEEGYSKRRDLHVLINFLRDNCQEWKRNQATNVLSIILISWWKGRQRGKIRCKTWPSFCMNFLGDKIVGGGAGSWRPMIYNVIRIINLLRWWRRQTMEGVR